MITIHWWNFGKKTLDFEGDYQDYLKHRDIKCEDISHPETGAPGHRFTIPVSSMSATLDTYGTEEEGAIEAIKIFLSMMGDQARLETRGRTYRINW